MRTPVPKLRSCSAGEVAKAPAFLLLNPLQSNQIQHTEGILQYRESPPILSLKFKVLFKVLRLKGEFRVELRKLGKRFLCSTVSERKS